MPIILNEDKVIKIARIIYVTFKIVSSNKFLKLKKSFNQTRNLLFSLSFFWTNKTYTRIPPIIARITETIVHTIEPAKLEFGV